VKCIQLDPDQPVADMRSMEEVADRAIAGARFNTVLLAVFAEIAFLLAAVGSTASSPATWASEPTRLGISSGSGRASRATCLCW